MIQRWTGRLAADRNAARVNEFTRLDPHLGSKRLQRGFKTGHVPCGNRGELIGQFQQSLAGLRGAAGFLYGFGIKRVVIGEEIIDPVRELLQELDLLFNEAEHFRIVAATRKRSSQCEEAVEREGPNVLSIHPQQLGGVEARVVSENLRQIEEFDD